MADAGFETAPLGQMMNKIKQAHAAGKFMILRDKQGNVPTFFKYQAKHFDFSEHLVKKHMGQETDEGLAEILRMNTVYAWRGGWTQGIDCGKMKVLLDQLPHNVMDMKKAFDFKGCREPAFCQAIPKEGTEELTTLAGDKIDRKLFDVSDDYMCVIISQAESDEDFAEILAHIPNHQDMAKLIIQ